MRAPKRGRPRDDSIDAVIHGVALRMLAERGYAGTSIERIAAEARVTRPTVYRRYDSKAQLVTAAVEASFEEHNPEVPDTGCSAEDVRQLIANTVRLVRDTPIGGVVRAIVPELDRDETLRTLARRMLGRRRKLLREAIRRGVERGEFGEDLNVELAIDSLLGAIYLRLLFTGGALSNRLAGDLMRQVLAPSG